MNGHKVKLRKYQLMDWINPDTVRSQNSWIVGDCRFCTKSLRSNMWKGHLQKCRKKQEPKRKEKQIEGACKSVPQTKEITEQIINVISVQLQYLLPGFLQMHYPSGVDPIDKQILFQRVAVGISQLMSNLTSSFASGLSLEDIQSFIPPSYHVNLSVLVQDISNLQNIPFLIEKISELKVSQQTKNNYRKALNLVFKKYNINYKFVLNYSDLRSTQNTLPNHHPVVPNAKSKFWSSSNSSLSDSCQEQNVQYSISQPYASPLILQQKMPKPKYLQNTKQNLFQTKTLKKIELKNSDKSLLDFAAQIQSLLRKGDENSFKEIKSIKIEKVANELLLELLLKKCEQCFNLHFENESIWFCQTCCYSVCEDCYFNLYCPCSKQSLQQFKLTVTELPSPKCQFAQSIPIINKQFFQDTNKMTKQQIEQFQNNMIQFMRDKFKCFFSRVSVFYDLDDQEMFNLFIDPYVKRAGKDLESIYQNYRSGNYLPPIAIKQSKFGGFGVFANKKIQKNAFLFEYAADALPSRVLKDYKNEKIKLSPGQTSFTTMRLCPIRHRGVGTIIKSSTNGNSILFRVVMGNVMRVIIYSTSNIEENEQILLPNSEKNV